MRVFYEKSIETRPINVSDLVEHTVREIAERIIEISGIRSGIIHEPHPQDHPKQHCPIIPRVKQVLNWEPCVPAEEGLKLTFGWFAERSVIAKRCRRTMRILLTGGAGFIGSHVADHLLMKGCEVVIVDDLSGGKRENVPEGAQFFEQDIRAGCEEVFEEFRSEVLRHQAAQKDFQRWVQNPYFDGAINVLGTIRLL